MMMDCQGYGFLVLIGLSFRYGSAFAQPMTAPRLPFITR
jgi:hypothetical protein